jgi:hypothetical protein
MRLLAIKILIFVREPEQKGKGGLSLFSYN